MHVWKSFAKVIFNSICFSCSRPRSGPLRRRSVVSEKIRQWLHRITDITPKKPTTPANRQSAKSLTEVVKLSEDLLCHSGPQGQLGVDKSDITRSASEILSVANSSLWQSTCQWLNIIDPAKVSLLVTCVLSTVRDRHFHILYTFFAPPQLESFKV